jgi:hypothetical protein
MTSIANQSTKELVDMYNSMVPANKRIKKFTDKPTAVKRITELLASQPTEKSPEPPTDENKKKTVEKILASNSTKTLPKTELETPSGKISMNLKVTTTTGIKDKIIAKQGGINLVGKKSRHAGKKIHILSATNPRLAGSEGWKNFNLYKEGMTYEQFILAKGGNNHLNWDIKKGFIELR